MGKSNQEANAECESTKKELDLATQNLLATQHRYNQGDWKHPDGEAALHQAMKAYNQAFLKFSRAVMENNSVTQGSGSPTKTNPTG